MKMILTDKMYNYREKFRNQPFELENYSLGAELMEDIANEKKNGRTHWNKFT